jgi:beta-galactosamide-alpha-2,3-sialyltransferase
MNIFFIRNRLQCLIAMQIQKEIAMNESYIAVFMYQQTRHEDSPFVYEIYSQFENRSDEAIHLVAGESFMKTFARSLRLILRSRIQGGTCFLASIDSLPIVLALRLCRGIRLETFDDGAANILPSSHYFREVGTPRAGLKDVLSRLLFPKGWAFWARQVTQQHHTIYPLHENIVDRKKLNILNWDWKTLLCLKDLESLEKNISIIILGSPSIKSFFGARDVFSTNFVKNADLYLKHPRESSVVNLVHVKSFRSPAEAILIYLAKKRRIEVFHFNSSVAYALEGTVNIDFINLINPETRQLLKEI